MWLCLLFDSNGAKSWSAHRHTTFFQRCPGFFKPMNEACKKRNETHRHRVEVECSCRSLWCFLSSQSADLINLNLSAAGVDLCLESDHGCEHICESSPGSFHCLCLPGYTLSDDGKTCAGKKKRTKVSFNKKLQKRRSGSNIQGQHVFIHLDRTICFTLLKPVNNMVVRLTVASLHCYLLSWQQTGLYYMI